MENRDKSATFVESDKYVLLTEVPKQRDLPSYVRGTITYSNLLNGHWSDSSSGTKSYRPCAITA